jgi:DNA-directed RNA polymerase specialized sigma24 family protein
MNAGPPSEPPGPGSGEDHPETGKPEEEPDPPEEWEPTTDPVAPVPLAVMDRLTRDTSRLIEAVQVPEPPFHSTFGQALFDALYRTLYRQVLTATIALLRDVPDSAVTVESSFNEVAREARYRGAPEETVRRRLWILVVQRSRAAHARPAERYGVSLGIAISESLQGPLGPLVRQSAVLAALDKLPQDQHEAIALRYYGDLSVSEVADALGLSPGRVIPLLRRGLNALQAVLESGT